MGVNVSDVVAKMAAAQDNEWVVPDQQPGRIVDNLGFMLRGMPLQGVGTFDVSNLNVQWRNLKPRNTVFFCPSSVTQAKLLDRRSGRRRYPVNRVVLNGFDPLFCQYGSWGISNGLFAVDGDILWISAASDLIPGVQPSVFKFVEDGGGVDWRECRCAACQERQRLTRAQVREAGAREIRRFDLSLNDIGPGDPAPPPR